MINCKNISKLVSEQQDTSLKYSKKIKIWLHLSYCKSCRKFNQKIKALSSLSKKFNEK